MMMMRPTQSDDIPALKRVLDSTDLFPSEMLPDMVAGFLANDDSEDVWLTCENEQQVIGFCYAVPEALTEGTWNMLAIAVLPTEQGKGAGGAIVAALESHLSASRNRVLIAETSGTDDFARTRNFYRKNGYTEEARIRDFWAMGDDKIVFWKPLG
jgi:ribosomal protein S18 acetylase RimI-like enzyme